MIRRTAALAFVLLCGMAGCAPEEPAIKPLPPVAGTGGRASVRVNGPIGAADTLPEPLVAYGRPGGVRAPSGGSGATATGGAVSLDFADTDIREVVAQILGNILKVNYTIDPGVHGTATLRTPAPLATSQLLPVLQALLAQDGASLVQTGGLYRVVSGGGAAAATPGSPVAPGPAGGGAPLTVAGNDPVAGTAVIPLRFASASELARVLQPYAGTNARITPDPGRNALILSGDPTTRAALADLVAAFDIDLLQNQSYALFPADTGDAKELATAMQDAFRTQEGGALAGVVRVVAMARINSVLVISPQPRYVDDARRIFGLMDRLRRRTLRVWSVYYLQSSHADDIAYVLQQAFTPNQVTAQPTTARGQTAPGSGTAGVGGNAQGGFGGVGGGGGIGAGANGGSLLGGGGGGIGGGGIGGSTGTGLGGGTLGGGGGGTQGGGLALGQPAGAAGSRPPASANPLLGGLDPGGSGAQGGGAANPDTMRIIPNAQNNAVLIYGTAREKDTVEAMLRKLDIVPLQVRIDATIAEVTLNDQLQYGTQFFFKSGGINGVLSNATQSLSGVNIASAALGTSLPGFVIGGNGLGGAPFAISALQAVTTVHVLSSPELLVVDNQPARLQVGNLVPFLTSSSQSTLTGNAPIVNSVNYQATGVILQVTPRVNNGGLITMDISQEVSDVDTSAPSTSGINSPTFLERSVTSRIVVQDGQTIGLAGLIRDSSQRGNSGLPWLKDIPILGFLAGTQNNLRARTELLVLITPHVVHDGRDARALTEDMREQLINAAAIPRELEGAHTTGSADPNQRVRQRLRLEQ